ncbi:MAG: helix-turn-helix domain-containing protein [Haloferacaceae archaeon]
MRSLRVVLDPDEATTHPMQAFVRDHADLRDYRLLRFNPTAEGDVALVLHVRGDRAAYESALAEYGPATSAVADGRGSSFYVYARESLSGAEERLVSAFTRAGLVVVSPVAYRDDGTIALGVVGPGDALRAALAAVPDGVGVDVRRVGRYDAAALAPAGRLTDRQHEALRVAHALGYYETPRAATTADVADRLGCAPGTAAEHLRKAEARLVERAVGSDRHDG